MTVEPWKRLEPTETMKAGYRTIVEKHFEMPSGLKVDRSIVNQDGYAGCVVIALTADNKVIIARQFRPGPEKIMDELPGGIMDEGETPEACVLRELEEESGYRPAKIEYLGSSYYDTYANGDRHNFIATGCTLVSDLSDRKQPEPDEDIEIRLVSIEELIGIAKQGTMTDPGAVLMALDRLREIQAQAA